MCTRRADTCTAGDGLLTIPFAPPTSLIWHSRLATWEDGELVEVGLVKHVNALGGFGASLLRQCCVIVPTFNASSHWDSLHAALQQQGLSKRQVLIIDSSSTDNTRELVKRAGYRLKVIAKQDFRHGATRQMAADLVHKQFLIFLTQDAIPGDPHCFSNLLSAFEDPDVGAAYGRQIARPDATPLDRHARLFNYTETSEVRDFSSSERMGFRAAFFSNSFAAYRRTAFEQVGGFPVGTIVSEEVSVAARMLMAQWKIAYQAEAIAIHSHRQTLRQEFRRYFDIGVHHGREKWIIDLFGAPGGEGRAFVRSQMAYLWSVQPSGIPVALLRDASKWIAYWLGTHERYVPTNLKRSLSAQKAFWSDDESRAARAQTLYSTLR